MYERKLTLTMTSGSTLCLNTRQIKYLYILLSGSGNYPKNLRLQEFSFLS